MGIETFVVTVPKPSEVNAEGDVGTNLKLLRSIGKE